MAYLQGTGSISKLKTALDSPVNYHLPIGEVQLPLNECLGRTLRIESLGVIHCSHCGRRTKRVTARVIATRA